MIKSDRYKKKQKKLKLSTYLVATTMLISFLGNKVLAQSPIVPDNTLNNENSTVTPNGQIEGLPAELIEGGAQRDGNLFHSFSQFNVEAGTGVYFANPEGVVNILSRVTGTEASEIMGRLGVQGNADLFLINPRGIVFGENASLDVNGSFVATTADAIQFGELGLFSSVEPNAVPLLTVKPSAFLFNQTNPGRIENRSVAPAGLDISETPLFGLRVPDGENLLLVGGETVVDGAGLHALNGRLELLSVAGTGNIELDLQADNPALIPAQLQLADISIKNGAFLNTSGEGGGEIILRGKNISMTNGSLLFADSLGDLNGKGISITAENLLLNLSSVTTDVLSLGGGGNITIDTKTLNLDNGSTISSSSLGQGNLGDNGNINIDATETIAINSSSIFNQTASGAVGNGGNIDFSTQELFLTNGSLISTNSFGRGDGGNINIDATLFSTVEGASLNSNLAGGAIGQAGDINIKANDVTFDGGFARSRLEAGAEGSGGNIQITTDSLLVTGIPPEAADSNTGQLVTATFGQGNSGSLRIDASGDVVFDGRGSDVFSLIGGNLADPNIPPAEGNAGNININAGSLLVNNQARLIGSVEGIGGAGDINIDTNSLSITNEGQLLTDVTNTGVGNAGDINIVAQSFDVTNGGIVSASTAGSGEAGNIEVSVNDLLVQNGGNIGVRTFNEGNAGNLTIMAAESARLIGQREPRESSNTGLFVGSQSATATGNGGNLEITTPKLEISDGAALTAIAQGTGNGGNIRLLDLETLKLRNNSLISTRAGSARTGGSGGNIEIETDFLITFPAENSDIIANAFEGNGGQINIDAQSIFNIEERRATEGNVTNDIDASSEFGLSGIVEIEVLDVDLSGEKIQLISPPTTTQVAQVCDPEDSQGENNFFVSGQDNSLQDFPTAAVAGNLGWEDWQIGESNITSPKSPTSGTVNKLMPSDLLPMSSKTPEIVEAQSWIVNEQGKVELVAKTTTSSAQKFWSKASPCSRNTQGEKGLYE
jgi:filamentous hemagglutinin family protein